MSPRSIPMNDISDVPEAAKQVLKEVGDNSVVAIKGEMGSGKTTLIKSMCSLLGVRHPMSSPTFAIVNEYQGESIIYHFDLYRLEKPDELDGIGFDEYVDSGNLCFIEWPEIAMDRLPENTCHLYIHSTEDGRLIEVSSP